MSGQLFTSFLPRIRDRGLSLVDSWSVRYGTGEEEQADEYFDLWSIKLLQELTPEDLLWCLVAAASDPFATHLQLYVFIGQGEANRTAEESFESLIDSFRDEFGFFPSEYGTDFCGEDGDFCVMVSLFSNDESERICTFLERE